MLVRNPSKMISFLINLVVGVIMTGIFFINSIVSSEDLQKQGEHMSKN